MPADAQEPIIRVTDIAWVRMSSPDIDLQHEFLTDFGLVESARTDAARYYRGTDADHHIYISQSGPAGILDVAFHAASEDDLHRLAEQAEGASPVEAIDEPGGGKRVRLKEPNGLPIDVVWGVETLPELPVDIRELNFGGWKDRRAGTLMRVTPAPSRVKRIAHTVIYTQAVEETLSWLHRHLGVVRSDDVWNESPDDLIASFNRADRGEAYVDHHMILVARQPNTGINHISFEVHDLDDLYLGHEHLTGTERYHHVWGIGRHYLGSQIFDYWKDPYDRVHEHWTDSDRLNAAHEYRQFPRAEGLRSQWGPQAPMEFRVACMPVITAAPDAREAAAE